MKTRILGRLQPSVRMSPIMRWALVIFIILLLLLGAMPQLRRFGLGRLPGDLFFSILGRKIELPFMSTILLAVLALVLGKLLF